jgi:hypothetical protein
LLRHNAVFDAVASRIPHLARWTEPGRFEPMTDVLPGGGLTNTYRGQARGVHGLYFVGDSVCTTNPAAGRGVSLGLLQAQALLGLLDEDAGTAAERFDAWCEQRIKPWFTDHVYWDASLLRRWRGVDLDPDALIPSDVICAAAAVDPSLIPLVQPYLAMIATPETLQAGADRVRELLRAGWRPSFDEGPTRDEVAAAVAETQLVSAAR